MAMEAADPATTGLALADTEINWDRFANMISANYCLLLFIVFDFHFFGVRVVVIVCV